MSTPTIRPSSAVCGTGTALVAGNVCATGLSGVFDPATSDYLAVPGETFIDGATRLQLTSVVGCNYGLAVEFAQGCSTVFVPDTCGACDGKVKTLALEYLGNEADDALIEVEQHDGTVVFADTVQPGEDGTLTTTPYSYDSGDRLLTEGATAYNWNSNGNIVQRSAVTSTSYDWDFDDRLVRVAEEDGTEVRTTYDADGNRVRTEVVPASGPSIITDYLVDTNGTLSHVVVESTPTEEVAAYYVRGRELLAVLRPAVAEKRFVHADGLG